MVYSLRFSDDDHEKSFKLLVARNDLYLKMGVTSCLKKQSWCIFKKNLMKQKSVKEVVSARL